MNVLFLTIGRFESIEQHAIYPDLLREFRNNGHKVFTVSSYERRLNKHTEIIREKGHIGLHVQIGNITKCSMIEKGLSTVLIEYQYKNAIEKHFSKVKFDLVLYSTPPITLVGVVSFIKKRDNAKSYLLLKDIFPQNAVDLGIMKKEGIKGFLYKYFRKKEKKLYAVSDRIGCMSQANVDYVIKHNPEINPIKVEICPNSIEVIDKSVDAETRVAIRKKYKIPLDKIVFVYGGNLGKPQGIPFLIKCLHKCKNIKDAYFLIVGDGTEYTLLEKYVNKYHQNNLKLMKRLPKDDYDTMVAACDVGMIFLDHRFTIPNFPSRLLAYMQAKLPVIAVTDTNTDIGDVIVDGEFGWWCEANNSPAMVSQIKKIIDKKIILEQIGENGWEYLLNNYSVCINYEIITKGYNKLLYHK